MLYILLIFAVKYNKYTNMDFDDYSIDIDAECVNQDFDDVDLYGEIMIEDDEETNIDFE